MPSRRRQIGLALGPIITQEVSSGFQEACDWQALKNHMQQLRRFSPRVAADTETQMPMIMLLVQKKEENKSNVWNKRLFKEEKAES